MEGGGNKEVTEVMEVQSFCKITSHGLLLVTRNNALLCRLTDVVL